MHSTMANILISLTRMWQFTYPVIHRLGYRSWVWIMVFGLLSSCSRSMPPAEYRAWVADPAHGLVQTHQSQGVSVTCAYRPIDLLVLQELATATSPISPASQARAYAGKTCCTLYLTRNGSEVENIFVNDPNTYEKALAYLNTGIAPTVYLATALHDSVPALASMYLRQYGATGSSTVLLTFDTKQLDIAQGFTVTWHDNLFGLGTQRFLFSANTLAAVPTVSYE